MARNTKRSLRRQASPSSQTTETTAASTPLTSGRASRATETPMTSDAESKVAPRVTRSRVNLKRAAKSDPEDAADTKLPATKKRAIGKNLYVEVPVRNVKSAPRGKGGIPELSNTPDKGESREFTIPRKSQAARSVPSSPPMTDDEILSQSEFDFHDVAVEESDDSGSEFVASSDENPYASETADASEDEELMIDAAVRVSLQAPDNGASSSSRKLESANPAAVLRAAAAERRLARSKANTDVDDFIMETGGDGTVSSSESDSESLLNKKRRGGAAKEVKATVPASKSRTMTIGMMTTQQHMTRKEILAQRRKNRKEEMHLIYKLGRKLTYAEKSTIALYKEHPELKDVWGDVEESIPIPIPTKADQPGNLKLTLLPFQRESLFWMREQENGPWKGGMLADEMGMGKTIQIIALLVTDGAKPNLVVAPTVAIMQWRNEINAHTDGLNVLVWHGSSRETDAKELKKYDVVLTTYAVLESSFRKQESGFKRKGVIIKQKSIVHQVKWNRIVLDEAHNIKERSTNTAKAAFELESDYRWCLSGTPLQNRVGELYSLVRFLGGDPFSYYFCKQCDCKSLHWKFSDKRHCDDCGHTPMQHTCFWNNEILTPIQKNGMNGPGKPAFKKLRILLDRMMLRRTKLQKADDLGLPPRTVIVRRDYFGPEEKELYLSLFSDAKRQFHTYLDQGTILNNYSNIFSLLTRMRQMACHPDLVLRSKTNASKFGHEETEGSVCRLCNDFAEDAIQSKCRHIFDRECIRQYLDSSLVDDPSCPVCHIPLTIDLEAPALELEENTPNVRQGILGRLNLDTWKSSTKIEALVEELSNLRMQNATTKSIVFSQFVNFLDLIAYRLQKAGFTICRLEGTMSPQARDATIKYFMNNVDVTVFLVSLKAGGVALNLTEASRVYLMDSWWNPAVEYQAMDRIHRLGQHRPVQAIKLVIEDSLESKIVELQEKKSAMVDATLSADDSAMGRLTPEDLGFLFRL